MNPTSTITAILNEAATLEDQAIKLREAAKVISDLSAKRVSGKKLEGNGILLSTIEVPLRKNGPQPKKKGKRKYTKKSAFWKKK